MIMRRLSVLLFAAILPLSGCVTAVASLQDKTLGESLDDAAASNEIKARLMAASPARFNEVDVEVANRVVLLSGRVPGAEDRREAEQIAWEVALVNTVANEIQVREKGGVRQNLNDEWITTRVRTRLLANDDVKSVNINIETYDGTVYLMGLARSQAELRVIAENAADVRGVREVVSYIQVRNSPYEPAQTASQQPGKAYNPYATSQSDELLGGPEY
ncbi:MAG: phospholipid-binding protein [Ponticaulis sp.]|nr:phospholipid-binding protein [Ponticaulis sp.]